MKNIIALVVLMSSIIYSQTTDFKSISELKQLSAVSYQLSAVDSRQLAVTSSQYPVSNNHQPTTINHQSVSIIQNPENSISKKNPALAILYSMLLPGMGELYANSYESGKYFTIADGALWGVFTGFTVYGNQQKNNYKSYAQLNGLVNLDGKDSDFFANIGAYLSLEDYNTAMELNRRFENRYDNSTHYWKWTSDDQRKAYRNIWTSSESAYTNVRFVVGALILNRVISSINAVRLVSAYNKNLSEEVSWNVSVGFENRPSLPSSITFNFVKRF